MLTSIIFVTDLFPDLQTLREDVRRDAVAVRKARLEQYNRQQEANQKLEPTVAN
jgi:hypothetical protein